jgi:hypothetical protein
MEFLLQNKNQEKRRKMNRSLPFVQFTLFAPGDQGERGKGLHFCLPGGGSKEGFFGTEKGEGNLFISAGLW